MKEPRDAYKVLQVDPEADPEVIQAAYRRLAQKYHPDRIVAGPDDDLPALRMVAALRMVEINAAWDELRDPGRRSEYDRRRTVALRAAAVARRPAAGPAPDHAPRRHVPHDGAAGAGPDAQPSAGPPPGWPSGSVLNFGRYTGWSLGEIGRTDPGYLEWLDRMPIGRPYRLELDGLLRTLGRRTGGEAVGADRRGLYRRR